MKEAFRINYNSNAKTHFQYIYICSCSVVRIFLCHKLCQIILHLYHHFEWIYFIVKLYVATFDATENKKGADFESLQFVCQ